MGRLTIKPRRWFLIGVIAIVVACCPFGRRVTLRTREGDLRYASRVPNGDLVWIVFDHSVNKSPVEDGYQLTEDGVALRSTRFRHYGAGIPDPEAGQVFTDHGEYFEITGYDVHLPSQWTYVGRVADHRLRIGEGGAEVHYNQLAEPGTALGLSSDRWSIAREIAWRAFHVDLRV